MPRNTIFPTATLGSDLLAPDGYVGASFTSTRRVAPPDEVLSYRPRRSSNAGAPPGSPTGGGGGVSACRGSVQRRPGPSARGLIKLRERGGA